MAFSIPTYRVVHGPSSGASGFWIHHTSSTTPTGQWGGVAIREMQFSTSYEWWMLFQLNVDPSWNTAADGAQFALPLDMHSQPGENGWTTVSPMHIKYENGNLMLQHQPNHPNHEWVIVSNLSKGVWHSFVVRTIFGRSGLSVPGHPNGGMGRTRVWVDGNDTPFDSGNCNNTWPFNAANAPHDDATTKLAVLEGNYSSGSTQNSVASFTASRMGATLSQALTDSSITKTGDIGVTPSNFYTTLTSRQDTDFVLPPSLGGGTPPPAPEHFGPWVLSVQYNSANETQPPTTVIEQHIGPWVTHVGYNSAFLDAVTGGLVLTAETATSLTLTPEVE